MSDREALWRAILDGAQVLAGSTALMTILPAGWANLAQATIGACGVAMVAYRRYRPASGQTVPPV